MWEPWSESLDIIFKFLIQKVLKCYCFSFLPFSFMDTLNVNSIDDGDVSFLQLRAWNLTLIIAIV